MTNDPNSLPAESRPQTESALRPVNRRSLQTAVDTGIVTVYERVNAKYLQSVERIVGQALTIEEAQTVRYVAHMVEPSVIEMRTQLLLAAKEACEDMRGVARQARARVDRVNNY